MDKKRFTAELIKLLDRHNIAIFVFGLVDTDPGGRSVVFSNTMIRSAPTDHEDEVLRVNIAKKAADLAVDLAKTLPS